jgi:uncharacterized protein with beta-barrel porin domain
MASSSLAALMVAGGAWILPTPAFAQYLGAGGAGGSAGLQFGAGGGGGNPFGTGGNGGDGNSGAPGTGAGGGGAGTVGGTGGTGGAGVLGNPNGGNGGTGGAHGATVTTTSTNTGAISGGHGGAAPSGGGGGGGGGQGGYGVVVSGTGITYTNQGTITGGTGGQGGGTSDVVSRAGAGGDGGVGVYVGGGSTFINSGTVTGGLGGAGGIHTRFSSQDGFVGNGGVGVYIADGGVLQNSGTIFGANLMPAVVAVGTTILGISNAGTISAHGGSAIVVTNVSSFSGGIVNSAGGVISSDGGQAGALIWVASASTFASDITNAGLISGPSAGANAGIEVNAQNVSGAITNSGTITVGGHGIVVGGLQDAFLTVSTFAGGIANSGIVAAGGNGIIVGANLNTSGAEVFVESFGGSIVNSAGGTISAGGSGIVVGGSAGAVPFIFGSFGSAIEVSLFSSGITNAGILSASVHGIVVGGTAGHTGNYVTISTFAGGITNSGRITAGANGVMVGGNVSGSNASVTIESFGGGIVNSAGGTISAGGSGVVVGGGINGSSFFTAAAIAISTFSGGISNSGVISASQHGILVGGIATGTFGSVTIASFSGGITNSHSITAGGNGIFVGGNANGTGSAVTISNFAGGISNAGTISAGGRGIFVGGTGTVGGTVTIWAFTGGITNTGLIAAATGIKIDVNVQSFSGAIANAGTISGTGGIAIDVSDADNAITINQTAGLISGAIKLSAHADVLNITGGTLAGDIVGTGSSDTVNFAPGAGNTFTYANNFTGINQVNVNSGTLVLTGNNAVTAMTVSNGGTLAGTGTIASALSIANGGTLLPGTPGTAGTTLHVSGTITFASGAIYLDTINAGTASKTAVTGTATLGGATVQLASGSAVTIGAKYTILTDTGGGLGGSNTFAGGITFNRFNGALSYDADDVFLTFTTPPPPRLVSLLPPGVSGNIATVAQAIDTFVSGGGTLPSGLQNLFSQSGPQLASTLAQLDGEVAADARTGAFSLMTSFLALLLDGSIEGRGDTGGGATSFAVQDEPALPPAVQRAYASALKPPPTTFDQRWGIWGTGFGGTNRTDGNATLGTSTMTARDYGFAAGGDHHVSPDTVLGFSLAGAGTNWGLAQSPGTGRSDAFMAGAYGTTHAGPAYLGVALAFADHWFTTNRTLLGDRLTARFNGQSAGTRLEGGYRISLPVAGTIFGFTPYAAAQAQWFRTTSYSETDLTGGGLGITYGAQTAHDMRGEVGMRFDDIAALGDMPLILRARAAWAHDWASSTPLNAAFVALPGSAFTVNGAALPVNSALTTASAELRFSPQWSFVAKFDGEFASTAQTYAGTGTLRYRW